MVGILVYVLLILGFALNTFFGMGPVLMADGGFGERMMTLVVVLVIYVVLIILFRAFRKRNS